MAAAARTFHLKGYRNSTIDDIAEAASISRPTVYKYIKSKQHLLDLMVEHVTGDLSRQLRAILDSGDPPHARLRAMIDAHIEAAAANQTFYAIVFSEEVELSARSRKKFRAWAHDRTQDFHVLLDECAAESSEGSPIDTKIAANLVLSMLSTLYRWYDPNGDTTPTELAKQIEILLGTVLPARP
jgi:TetR/AcrR family transcriptional regulator, cholesterol catabolism regulator